MAGMILTDSGGKDIGFFNFFGSHGTSNGIDNKLVASDHKGYAALKVEEQIGDGFVALLLRPTAAIRAPTP